MSKNFYPLSQLQFHITSMICTNGDSLKCFSGGKTESEPRTVQEYEWVLFLNDGGKTNIDNEFHEIHTGDIRILKPGQTVSTSKFGDVFVLHFKIVDNRQNEQIAAIPTFSHFDNIDLKIYCDLFNRMLAKYIDDSEINRILLQGRFYELLAFVLKATKSTKIYSKNSFYIEKAKKYIDEHYYEPLTLETIAKEVSLHPNYFHKVFKNSFGITPREYLTKIRLNNAKNFLLSTTLSVEEISLKCGFDSTSYFIKLFKKEYSITPALYREKMLYNIE